MSNFEEIEAAKAVLKKNGYQVDNLWCIEDVKSNYDCSDEDAYGIIYAALTNDATMEQIWFAIDFHAEDAGFEKKDDNLKDIYKPR